MIPSYNKSHNRRASAGFTLLEVILSVSILLVLSIAATTIIRNSLKMKVGMAAQAALTHKLNVLMQKITTDLSLAYIIDSRRSEINWGGRSTKTIFAIKRDGSSYELAMTTMSHHSLIKNAHESDETFVVYKLKNDEANPSGRTSLFRGETKVLPQNFDEEIKTEILAEGIKSFKLSCWTGERWVDDRWDSNRSEWRNKLPPMVKIEIEAYDNPSTGSETSSELVDAPFSRISTVVYLPRSYGTAELKQRGGRAMWEGK